MHRSDFPLLNKHSDLVYLDSANTTLKPQTVIDAICDYYTDYTANFGRASYPMAAKVTSLVEKTRANFADFIGATSDQLSFTYSATYALNQVATLCRSLPWQHGDIILLSYENHNSNIVPWLSLAKHVDATIVYIEDIDPNKYNWRNVKLFSYSLASNITGQVFDYRAISQSIQESGGLVAVDATQALTRLPINVDQLHCDFLVGSAHKIYAPTGLGMLYIKDLSKMPPIQPLCYGSSAITDITPTSFVLAPAPSCLEPGTPNISAIIGLKSALDYINKIGVFSIFQHELQLERYLSEQLYELKLGKDIIAPLSRKVGIVALSHPGVHPHDIDLILSEQNIAVRTGFCCSNLFMKHHKLPRGIVRLSFGLYNTQADIDKFVGSYSQAIKELCK